MYLELVDPDALKNVPDAGTSCATGSAGRACYTEPAAVADVLFEQLDYLLAHESAACPPGCSDCARLAHVRDWLLQPFRPASNGCSGSFGAPLL